VHRTAVCIAVRSANIMVVVTKNGNERNRNSVGTGGVLFGNETGKIATALGGDRTKRSIGLVHSAAEC